MIITPPEKTALNEYYSSYWKYLEGNDLLDSLVRQKDSTYAFLGAINQKLEDKIYAPGKWMLKEVAGHLCDTERILSCRALRFARKDNTPLPGFDESRYEENSLYRNLSLITIADELKAIRISNLFLFSSFRENELEQKGKANNIVVSVRDILYFILVHQQHHLKVIREKYLGDA